MKKMMVILLALMLMPICVTNVFAETLVIVPFSEEAIYLGSEGEEFQFDEALFSGGNLSFVITQDEQTASEISAGLAIFTEQGLLGKTTLPNGLLSEEVVILKVEQVIPFEMEGLMRYGGSYFLLKEDDAFSVYLVYDLSHYPEEMGEPSITFQSFEKDESWYFWDDLLDIDSLEIDDQRQIIADRGGYEILVTRLDIDGLFAELEMPEEIQKQIMKLEE